MEILRDALAALVALIHVYIFVLESVLWSRPKTMKIFGVNAEQSAANRQFAFNQGFYNLFLAFEIALGFALLRNGEASGRWLIDFAVMSVFGAGFVLYLSGPRRLRASLVQTAPSAAYLILRLIL